jgi:hypothetical protein
MREFRQWLKLVTFNFIRVLVSVTNTSGSINTSESDTTVRRERLASFY